VSSCLKDKGFEDNDYGIDIEDIKGVAFPLAPSSPVIRSINSQTTTQDFECPNITLEQEGAAASDVTVTVTLNNALVAAAMAADPTLNLTVLPADAYTIPTTSIVIPAGQKFSDALKLSIPNSSTLDPTLTFAVGFTITAVSPGYTIAANQKDIVVGFSIKNKYDGIYSLRFRSTGWAAYGIADDAPSEEYETEVDMETSGANSNRLFNNYFGDYLLPGFTGGLGTVTGPTGFGVTAPEFVFDLNTNALIDVRNTAPPDARNRTLAINPAVTDSRYDPNTKTIYASFIMGQTGRPNQIFYDTLTFERER
jgi:Domain of unknown function (DUF1735)